MVVVEFQMILMASVGVMRIVTKKVIVSLYANTTREH
jgi:hypothetical protein